MSPVVPGAWGDVCLALAPRGSHAGLFLESVSIKIPTKTCHTQHTTTVKRTQTHVHTSPRGVSSQSLTRTTPAPAAHLKRASLIVVEAELLPNGLCLQLLLLVLPLEPREQ